MDSGHTGSTRDGDPVAPKSLAASSGRESDRESALRRFIRRFGSNRIALAALIVLILMVLCTIAAPLLAPYNPDAIDVRNRLSGPTISHWLGTDSLGRDTLSRIIYAGRASLFAAASRSPSRWSWACRPGWWPAISAGGSTGCWAVRPTC